MRRNGTAVSLISYGKSVRACEAAADLLAAEGISADVLDLRSLKPLDERAILATARARLNGQIPGRVRPTGASIDAVALPTR